MRSVAVVLVAAMLIAFPSVGQSQELIGSFFAFGADVGHGRWLGAVARGARITVDLTTVQMRDIDTTCPFQASIWIIRENNRTGQQRRNFRGNGSGSRFQIARVNFYGDAFLSVQAQNFDHDCLGLVDVFINQLGGAPAVSASPELETQEQQEPVPDVPVPVDPEIAKQLRIIRAR